MILYESVLGYDGASAPLETRGGCLTTPPVSSTAPVPLILPSPSILFVLSLSQSNSHSRRLSRSCSASFSTLIFSSSIFRLPRASLLVLCPCAMEIFSSRFFAQASHYLSQFCACFFAPSFSRIWFYYFISFILSCACMSLPLHFHFIIILILQILLSRHFRQRGKRKTFNLSCFNFETSIIKLTWTNIRV